MINIYSSVFKDGALFVDTLEKRWDLMLYSVSFSKAEHCVTVSSLDTEKTKTACEKTTCDISRRLRKVV